MILTPCVFLPCTRISLTGIRMIIPSELVSITSSSLTTALTFTTGPLRRLVTIVITPRPPLCIVRYSPNSVRFPNPFSVIVKRVALSSTISILTTASPSSSRIPRTPRALLPIGRTSDSANRMALPCLDTITTSREPSVMMTFTSSSSSSKVTAIIPPFLGLLKSESALFLTVPDFVPINRYLSSSNLLTGIIAVTDSSSPSSRKFTIAFPRDCLLADGIAYTFLQCILPLFVKHSK